MPSKPQMRQVRQIYAVMRSGGIVLLRLDVGYALICMNKLAIKRIYRIKRRPSARPIVILGTQEIFNALAISRFKAKISLFPYPVGLIVRIDRRSIHCLRIPPQAVRQGTIAIFLNMGDLPQCLARYAFARGHRLIFGSSANFSNHGNHYSSQDVEPEIRAQVDLQIDQGESKYGELGPNGKGLGTTILDLDSNFVVRHGILAQEVIREARKLGLFSSTLAA